MILSTPSDSEDLDGLFARAREGDEAAWQQLFQQCYQKVIRVVRRKLNSPMRSLYDSTDFASDVMKSLAANANRLDFPSFDSLVAFLVQVAEKKVIDEYRKVHTLKRDIDRQCPLTPGHGDEAQPLSLASDDPTASQLAQATEANEQLLSGQSESQRQVIELRKQGYSNSEIARETGWNVRKVQRFLQDLWESWGLSRD
jgi:RNA polymerase sigma factor (sigma-70 family)